MAKPKAVASTAKAIAGDTVAFQRLMELQQQTMEILNEARRSGLHVQVAVQDAFPVFTVCRFARRMPQHPRAIQPSRMKACGCDRREDCDCDDEDGI